MAIRLDSRLPGGQGLGISLLMRWLHLGGAAALLGGLLFAGVALLPALRAADPEQAVLLMREATARFRRVLWVAAAALLLSGAYAYHAAGAGASRAYLAVAGIKIVLALAALVLVLGPAWPASSEAPLSRRRRDWLSLSLLLAVVVTLLSSVLWALRR